MKGVISVMSTPTDPGRILTADGSSVRFDPASVLAYDLASLAVGRPVTFDIAGGRHPTAINVHTEVQKYASSHKLTEVADIRFVGFVQKGNNREYRFEWLSGETRRSYSVTGEMGLFTRHHVQIQEGPAICLRFLMGHLETAGAPPESTRWSLTDADMSAHLASRALLGKPGPRQR